jgi:error-prone DNA polymerase
MSAGRRTGWNSARPALERGGAHVLEPPLRVTLLARDKAGWGRLRRVVSAAHASAGGGAPVASWGALREHAGVGLTVLLGPVSESVRALSAGRPDIAERLVAPWRDLLGASLRLEVLWYGLPGTGPGSVRLAARTLGLADQLGLPAVLTNAVRYADPGQHRLADVLDSARLLRPIDRRRRDCGERSLKAPAAMAEVAGRIALGAGAGQARAVRLFEETVRTAEQCDVDPVRGLGLGSPHFPEPETVGAADAADADRLLRERCEAGLAQRGLDRDPAARERLEQELAVIARLSGGFASYFLTVAQVVADVREMGIRVAARGSGAGSMVNHVLFIATANPLDHKLLFERFLSERRKDLPDIDIDVESARRLEVYDRIFERFGRERVAVTGMPETYRAQISRGQDSLIALACQRRRHQLMQVRDQILGHLRQVLLDVSHAGRATRGMPILGGRRAAEHLHGRLTEEPDHQIRRFMQKIR